MCLLGVFVSLIMVTHVVLFGCVEMVTCCFVMMPRGIHMRLFCHGLFTAFSGKRITQPLRWRRISPRYPPTSAPGDATPRFVHLFNKRRPTNQSATH